MMSFYQFLETMNHTPEVGDEVKIVGSYKGHSGPEADAQGV